MNLINYFENIAAPEKAFLIGIDTGDFDSEASLNELKALCKTAGAEIMGTALQKRPSLDSLTAVGGGKLRELKDFCHEQDVNLLVFDCELTAGQIRNIEKITDIRCIDRTMLILDIFAARARSSEGKLQIELAQLKYMLPHLTGQGKSLSRLGGGIGTRGPGESKLESDRRHIRRRIDALEQKLRDIGRRRNHLRSRRKKNGVETVAIVGYTNAGKSTLMNALTDAGVLVEDKLFATLDPTSRALRLPDGRKVMLIDTVGFVSRLPHHLIEAFKSTLEEASQADLILNVCDASDPDAAMHLEVSAKQLRDLNCGDKPILTVMNKCDRLSAPPDTAGMGKTVLVSALRNEGLTDLLNSISAALPHTRQAFTFLIPFNEGSSIQTIRDEGVVVSEEFTADGILLKAIVDVSFAHSIRGFIL